jgi:hypothetical protein
MELPIFSIEDLKSLPLRAMVAFAVRCARRVEHLAQLPEGDVRREQRRLAIDEGLRMAEAVARGDSCPSVESIIPAIDASRHAAGAAARCASAMASARATVHAAASVLSVMDCAVGDQEMPLSARRVEARKFLRALESTTADLAAMSAFTAATNAYDAVGLDNEDLVASSMNDFDRLSCLDLSRFPELGEPIDASPGGPLGPIHLPSQHIPLSPGATGNGWRSSNTVGRTRFHYQGVSDE